MSASSPFCQFPRASVCGVCCYVQSGGSCVAEADRKQCFHGETLPWFYKLRIQSRKLIGKEKASGAEQECNMTKDRLINNVLLCPSVVPEKNWPRLELQERGQTRISPGQVLRPASASWRLQTAFNNHPKA